MQSLLDERNVRVLICRLLFDGVSEIQTRPSLIGLRRTSCVRVHNVRVCVCAFRIKPHLLGASASRDYVDKRTSSSRDNQRANAAMARRIDLSFQFARIRKSVAGNHPLAISTSVVSFRHERARTARFTVLIRGEIRARVFPEKGKGKGRKWRTPRDHRDGGRRGYTRAVSRWLAGRLYTRCLHERLPSRHCSRRQCIRITVVPDALNYNDRQDIR